MHCSKGGYFPLQGNPESHIRTVANWLNDHFGCSSVFTLPFVGEFTYQSQGRLIRHEISRPIWIPDTNDFDGVQDSIMAVSYPEFSQAYDWVHGMKTCDPSTVVSPDLTLI